MKNQITTYKRMYKIFITVVILSYTSLISMIFVPLSSDLRLSISLALIVFLLVFSLVMRPKLFVLSIAYHYARMKQAPGQMITPKIVLDDQAFKTHLIHIGFLHFKRYQEFSIYYRIKRGDANFLEKRGIAEFFVIISNPGLAFHHDSISDGINEVEDFLQSQKEKYNHYVVLNLKTTPSLSEEQMEQADQIIFEKHKNHHIAVTNGYYDTSKNHLYLLYSDAYAPTILYHHAIQTYQEIII